MLKFSLFPIDPLRLIKNVCFKEPKDPLGLEGQSTLSHDTSSDWVDISAEICGSSNDERCPDKDGVNTEITSTTIPEDQDCPKIPIKKKRISNRLELTNIIVRPALVVVVEEKGWKQSGCRAKRIFDSIYSTLGKNSVKIIEVRVEQNYLKIYSENDGDRSILMKELKDMNQFVKETSPYQLYIQNPFKPSIQFLCCAETYKMSSCDLIALIRRENNWDSEWTVNIESKEWIRKLRKAKLSLIIDSRIRDKIDTEEGIIYIAGKETKIFDKFGITQCSVCLRLGHSKCRSRIRCFFCSGFHSDKFRHDKYAEKKFCFLCRAVGHAPISKNCPTLVAEIQSKLELIDHKYKDIFIGTDRSY